MSDERPALDHLLRGVEELLRAGAEATALLRARSLPRRDDASPKPQPLLDALRSALRREVARWELRGDDDPAARRVRDLFEAILEVIEVPEAEADTRPRPEDRARTAGTRAPRRGVQR